MTDIWQHLAENRRYQLKRESKCRAVVLGENFILWATALDCDSLRGAAQMHVLRELL